MVEHSRYETSVETEINGVFIRCEVAIEEPVNVPVQGQLLVEMLENTLGWFADCTKESPSGLDDGLSDSDFEDDVFDGVVPESSSEEEKPDDNAE